ncbi:MAG: hypothetical protein IKW50_03605, partial [Oscillospiraceae bacterium]|nr:hypothetical protein [Oscillospiraceae bacterium]
FGENAISTAQSLSQNRFRRAGFASSLYTREPWGAPAPVQQWILRLKTRGGGRVAERSESKNNMIAGGNHTIMQQ